MTENAVSYNDNDSNPFSQRGNSGEERRERVGDISHAVGREGGRE